MQCPKSLQHTFWMGWRYSQFNEVLIKNYDEKSEAGYILEAEVHYPEKSYELHGDLPFLPENVHKAISFNQGEWLKPYIEMNNKLRREERNEFEKDFFKLMNNAVFGKTRENVKKHRDI